MPDKVETVVRYADACREAAGADSYFAGTAESIVEAEHYRTRAAALRALADEIEQIERRCREHGPDKWSVGIYDTAAAFCNRIAAGYLEGR